MPHSGECGYDKTPPPSSPMNTHASTADETSSPRAKRTLQRRILTLVAALNVASTVVGCAIAYHFQKEAFIHGIDRVLTTGAIGAQHVYGDRFQQEMLQGKKFTPAEELAHIERISDLTDRLNLNYIGALVRRDG